MRALAVLLVAFLSACSSSSSPAVRRKSASPSSAISPRLAAQLTAMQRAIRTGDMERYRNTHAHALRAARGRARALAALAAVDARLAAIAGGHAMGIRGWGRRVGAADPVALGATDDAIAACREVVDSASAEDLDEAYRTYESSLKRATQIDVRALRYASASGDGRRARDNMTALVTCEFEVAWRRAQLADIPPAEAAVGRIDRGCGFVDYRVSAVRKRHDRFGPFELDIEELGRPERTGVALACDKLPAVAELTRPLRDAVDDLFPLLGPSDVVAQVGPLARKRDGNQIVRVATLRVYSKRTPLPGNPCGGADSSLRCQASGSIEATAYNHLRHYLLRADVRRKTGRTQACRDVLAMAADEAVLVGRRRSDSANPERKYKTIADGVIDEESLLLAIGAMAQTARERHGSDWCDAPATGVAAR